MGSILIWLIFNISDQVKEQEHFAILHKYRQSTLVSQNNDLLQLFSDGGTVSKTIGLYQENTRVNKIQQKILENYYINHGKELLIIDSLAIYNIPGAAPDYILLRQSPKINLERLLKTFPQAEIIADGSNYKSYIDRWKITCAKQKTPFHSTYEKGAFIIN